MSSFVGQYIQQRPNKPRPYFLLKPNDEDLSETFFDRNPDSHWKNIRGNLTQLYWTPFNWDGKLKIPLEIIAVPEFICRYGFVSSYAFQINQFADHLNIATPKEFIFQLLYIALLSSSQVQFYYVLQVLISEKQQLLAKYSESKNISNDIDITLFRRYQQIVKKCKFNSMTGGPYNRFQAQPTNHAIFRDDKELRFHLKKMPMLIENINLGRYLERDGLLGKPPGKELPFVGDVGSLSFAPLVVFCGMASSVHAINTAKQSRVNQHTTNSYYEKVTKFLDDHDTAVEKTKKDAKFLMRIFRAIAKSWNDVSGSVENACCAAFREKKPYDIFFRGQDIYILDDLCSYPKVKRYGSYEWEKLTFPKSKNNMR